MIAAHHSIEHAQEELWFTVVVGGAIGLTCFGIIAWVLWHLFVAREDAGERHEFIGDLGSALGSFWGRR